jgi:transposase
LDRSDRTSTANKPSKHRKQAEQAPHQPVEQRQQHFEMVPASQMTRSKTPAHRAKPGLRAGQDAVTTHVRAFAAIMTGRRGRELEQWMTAAAASGEPALKSFVTGLRAGQDAVTAGLTLQWSSGCVEGHVNRNF